MRARKGVQENIQNDWVDGRSQEGERMGKVGYLDI